MSEISVDFFTVRQNRTDPNIPIRSAFRLVFLHAGLQPGNLGLP